MIKEPFHRKCILCQKPLAPPFHNDPGSSSFGPLPRSKEHIFPVAIGGRISTQNVCKPCNDKAGHELDIHLLRDQRVNDAAVKAGIDSQELLRSLGRLPGIEVIGDGREIALKYNDGTVRVTPKVKHDNFVFPYDTPKDRSNIKRILTSRHEQRGDLDSKVIGDLVDSLLNRLDDAFAVTDGGTEAEADSPELGETVRLSRGSKAIQLQIDSTPLLTDRAIAKIIHEVAFNWMPFQWAQYLQPVRDELRTFFVDLDQILANGSRVRFDCQTIEPEDSAHLAEISISRNRFSAKVTLFGSAEWNLDVPLQVVNAPRDEGGLIRLTNPLEKSNRPILKSSW